MVDIDQILALLPHRYPFLMVDKVVEVEAGKRLVAVKNVTINEPHFQGHYPRFPVMPGVLILEAMAQAGGLAAASSQQTGDPDVIPLLAAVDKAKFRKMVRPGDQLVIEVDVLKVGSRLAKVAAKALVEGELAAESELTFVLSKRGASL
ncbi:MAG TPA: 3-hydroxyacyl-ACP dehydratase FabZ [Limnochordia bacterium]|nr:3-hydroxyacyl-ACP dehydratase FabZ [Bacillota bacterium]HPT93086.1 3-hydroxyacyl-ACP dehydratase FabZ [Limnochordia bacterium]